MVPVQLSDCSVYVLRHPHIPPSSSLILTNPSLFLLHPHTANGPLVKSIMCMLLAKQGYIMLWGLLLTSVDLKKKRKQTILVSYYIPYAMSVLGLHLTKQSFTTRAASV